MDTYTVFQGIELTFYAIHSQSITVPASSSRTLEIIHCREGRMEFGSEQDPYYLSPGDIALACQSSEHPQERMFPMRHYHGLSIHINMDIAPTCLSCFLDDVSVRPEAIAEKFCSDSPYFVARSTPQIAHIFTELYEVPEQIRSGYFKVKILELMLFLSDMLPAKEIQRAAVSRSQVEIAKKVSQYLSEHITQKITLDDLAQEFNASVSHIQNSFKLVYGASVAAFIRNQRMHEAALLLQTTDRTIADIAGEFGYDNASKFAKAFRDIMEMTPNEYRKANQR